MSEALKEFIFQHFFRKDVYPGERSIAYNLMEKGECIVAGTTRLWHGGVGNFITVTPAEGTIGCSLHVFDKQSFLESAIFVLMLREYVAEKRKNLKENINALKKQLKDLDELENYSK